MDDVPSGGGPQFGSLPPVVMKLAVLNCDAFCVTLLGGTPVAAVDG